MNQKHLLRFIKKTMRTHANDQVYKDKTGEVLTLQQVSTQPCYYLVLNSLWWQQVGTLQSLHALNTFKCFTHSTRENLCVFQVGEISYFFWFTYAECERSIFFANEEIAVENLGTKQVKSL